ncbi:4-hydroxy-tetrahydrodipicolinate reductase [Alicyclobacillus sp. ALC3]|uniref:4-hydroxy-tetrahydrodipicolinate reductase n=1 Tax=Alicyclobacillus sp. ALC3 TaxID=2796143 RepID=UPI0023798ADA|nr:dihydrodipicolinate reductase C-terminal domain-containing protein [Alicyclobacillus sp. ALC3]WDL98551.1 hypothetical protein JC200_07715 [Alicyclobacillus sp. ALC3]
MKRIIMGGITGHTGIAVARCIDADPNLKLVAAVGKLSAGNSIGEVLYNKPDDRLIFPDLYTLSEVNSADFYVDFTTAESAQRNLSDAATLGLKLVVGTTGIPEGFLEDLAFRLTNEQSFALISSNFSLGIVALTQFAKKLSTLFGPEHIEIFETHNVTKKDIPSGTALFIQKQLSTSEQGLVPIHSLRVSGTVSRHEIHATMHEQVLSIKHEVTNPETFGLGVTYVLNNCDGVSGVFRDLASFKDASGAAFSKNEHEIDIELLPDEFDT